MPTYKIVASRSLGIRRKNDYAGPAINPFLIRNVFDPSLVSRREIRTWDNIECESEKEAREMFEEARQKTESLTAFQIDSIERVAAIKEK